MRWRIALLTLMLLSGLLTITYHGVIHGISAPDAVSRPYAHIEVVSPADQTPPTPTTPHNLPAVATTTQWSYVAIKDSCGPYFEGECVNIRTAPTTTAPRVLQARAGIVLGTDGVFTQDGVAWYRITFEEWVRYPERIVSEWYVASSYTELIDAETSEAGTSTALSATKRIVIDRGDQTLTAYNEGKVFMYEPISTGLELTPTPRGTFAIFRKQPSRYMQGPLPGISNQYFDLPGVPWNLYFTKEGGAIHGTYWHNEFGTPWSHGCVNLPPEKARQLYEWADLGTIVVVRD